MTLKIIQAVTSLRVGDGSSASAIDLPLSRECHTRWPFLPGSSLKGALRIRATLLHGVVGRKPKSDIEGFIETPTIQSVFGGPPRSVNDEDESTPMGSLLLCGATLLALPVRSLTSTFVLLTSPTALARFGRELRDAPPVPEPSVDEAWVADGGRVDTSDKSAQVGERARGVLVLEDLDLVGATDSSVGPWVEVLRRFVGDAAPLDLLTVVHDDVFSHACAAWTELRTRNAVGDNGVVKDGALFTVETLPAETLLWTCVTWRGEPTGEQAALLPNDGETWAVGGHQGVGLGRICWYGGAA